MQLGERHQGHLRPGLRAHVDAVQSIRILLELRVHFKHNAILVQLGKDRRNLALAKGVVERVVNRLGQNAKARRRIAVDGEVGIQSAVKLVGRDIAQLRLLFQFLQKARRPLRKLIAVGILDANTGTGYG